MAYNKPGAAGRVPLALVAAGVVAEAAADAAEEAKRLVAEKGLTFIPPYDDPDVIAGQGTVAKEILEQRPEVDSIFVPIGGGGFAAGVSAYVKGGETAVAIISGANMNFASLCFISSDAAFARLKDKVLADGRVDLAEARYILSLLDEGFTPSDPLARLMRLLRTAVGDGAVSKAQSREIARALDETLNLQMTTAEERHRFMY